ncbi:uncharacterized protein LOC123528048 [Mercenaria mercenaria]|uniref:uncharacterized protein LOC123528048 n=1 Tax=Mercenaria mercenaria TaxID=6596 RepID=UPI00234F099A|nr:uncharacterized protein LOC123528048 [Mercenaria mercenaria]
MDGLYKESHVRIDTSHGVSKRTNLIDCLQEYATTKPDTEAFVFASTTASRESVTWLHLYQRACATGRSLIQLGIKRNETIAINLRTCPEWLYAAFGAMIAGAVPVGISFTYKDGASDLIATMEKLQNCSILIMDPGLDNVNWNIIADHLDHYDKEGSVRSKKMPYLRYMLGHAFANCQASVKQFQDLFESANPDIVVPKIDAEDAAMMLQTPGSTGIPKFVVHTHKSLVAMGTSNSQYIDNCYSLFNDRPFTWVGGFLLSVLTGQTRVTVSGFCASPKNVVSFMVDVIQNERCSLVLALPPLMAELMKRQNDLPADWPVEVIMSGGQPLTKSLVKCIGKVCKSFGSLYAGTEVLGLTQLLVRDPENFSEYGCGKALHMKGFEMKIVNEDGKTVPVNTRGEIFVKSPAMFKEYYNDSAKTRQAKSDDGWFKTDDIGRMTKNGEFFVESRKSNTIISGGMNLAPEILEQVMKSFPGVDAVVYVPVPDEVLYQAVCACVIKKPGCDITEEKLRSCCEEFHADKPGLFTVLPKYYIFLDRFPLLSSGKVNRVELKRNANELLCL